MKINTPNFPDVKAYAGRILFFELSVASTTMENVKETEKITIFKGQCCTSKNAFSFEGSKWQAFIIYKNLQMKPKAVGWNYFVDATYEVIFMLRWREYS